MTTRPVKKTFVLRDRGGCLDKNWYVEVLEGTKRVAKKYEGINAGKTAEERRANANRLIRKLKKEAALVPASIDEQERIYAALESKRAFLGKKSYQTYKSKIDRLFRHLGREELTTDWLRSYFQAYRSEHTQQGTYDQRRQLMTFFKIAGLEHLLAPIKIKKGNSEPLLYFQSHQREQLLRHLQVADPQLFLHCLFIYFCAIRPRSELIFIRAGQIDWHRRQVLVRSENAKNNTTQPVGLAAEFLPFIEHLKHCPPNQYIFPSTRHADRPPGRNHFGRKFREVLDSFGYGPDYQLYSWKHTGAVEAYKENKDILALQVWCRHSDVRETQRYVRQLGLEDFGNFYQRFPSPVVGLRPLT